MKKYKITVDGQIFDVVVEEVTDAGSWQNQGASHPKPLPKPSPLERSPGPRQIRPAADDAFNVEAPMPGSIIDIAVKSGERVKEGDILLILEAMKMENEITAPRPGTVSNIYVNVGDTVSGGEPLMELT